MFSKLESVGLFGIDTYMIEIEADVSGGLPAFDIVGLPDAAVKESRDRVRAAIKNCGYKFGKWHSVVFFEKQLNEFSVPPKPVIPITELEYEF